MGRDDLCKSGMANEDRGFGRFTARMKRALWYRSVRGSKDVFMGSLVVRMKRAL